VGGNYRYAAFFLCTLIAVCNALPQIAPEFECILSCVVSNINSLTDLMYYTAFSEIVFAQNI
jgi:hypothetical protein